MIFKRREKRSFWDTVRDLVQPRKGWRRGFKYIGRRVQRLPDTPHRIALGFACGAMASFSPFFTLHALVAVIFAYAVRGNLIAAAFGTIVGNPVSFPFIAAASMGAGNWLLGRVGEGEDALAAKMSFTYLWEHPVDFLESIFTPYLIGGLAPGLICALAFYFALRPMVGAFQERRRQVLSSRARELVKRRRAAAKKSEPGDGDGSGAPSGNRGGGPALAASKAAKPMDRLSSALPPLRPPRPASGSR